MANDGLVDAMTGLDYRYPAALRAQLSCSEELAAHHPDIGQRKQRVQLGGVLGQAAVADFDVAELPLDYPEGVFATGAHLRLETFDPVTQLARCRIAQCPALARPHRHMPLDPPFALGPLVDAESGLVHSLIGTAANIADVTKAHELLHGGETVAFGDAGYIGVEQRPECQRRVEWQVAMRPGKRRALRDTAAGRLRERIEHLKAQVRARGEHAFRVIKRQFGYLKVRYRGLTKNTAQLHTLFALANIWMVRRQLLATG